MHRIVSLVPSITELLFYLGLGSCIVGRTKFCIHPKECVDQVTKIGGTKKIRIDVIRTLKPDLIIANKEENEAEQIRTLANEFNILLTHVKDYEGALAMIARIGKITSTLEEANRLMSEIENKFTSLEKANKSCIYLIWRDPYMTVGGDTYIHSMLEKCGFKNLLGQEMRYPVITLERIKELQPDEVFLSSEPYPFQASHVESLIDALPASKVRLVDGEMWSWYGNRMLALPDYVKGLV